MKIDIKTGLILVVVIALGIVSASLLGGYLSEKEDSEGSAS